MNKENLNLLKAHTKAVIAAANVVLAQLEFETTQEDADSCGAVLSYTKEELKSLELESKSTSPKTKAKKTAKSVEDDELLAAVDGEDEQPETEANEDEDYLSDALGEPEEIITADMIRAKASSIAKTKGTKGKDLVRKTLAKYSKGETGQVKDIPAAKYAETLHALNKLK